jgi:outer membrane protein OmpA-like peptidoglycan-associated protein
MNRVTRIFVLALALTSSTAVHAADLTDMFGIGVSGGVPFAAAPSRLQNLSESGWNAGAHVRYHLSSALALGIAYNHVSLMSGKDVMQNQANLFAHYRLLAKESLSPVLEFGLGAARTSDYVPGKSPYFAALATAKLGVEYLVSKCVSLGFYGAYSATHRPKAAAGMTHIVGPLASLTFYMGGNDDPAPVAQAAAPAAPAPAKAQVSDTDGDGVIDSEDKCPTTPARKRVNAFGCQPEEKVNFTLKINFPIGKTTVDKKYDKDLSNVAEFMKKYPNPKGEVQGHTDNVGLAANNEKLSSARAEAVRKVLTEKFGVESSRLTAKGYGPAQPITDNKTAAGRAENRRVVVSLDGTTTE